jgi:hypothetical protein
MVKCPNFLVFFPTFPIVAPLLLPPVDQLETATGTYLTVTLSS